MTQVEKLTAEEHEARAMLLGYRAHPQASNGEGVLYYKCDPKDDMPRSQGTLDGETLQPIFSLCSDSTACLLIEEVPEAYREPALYYGSWYGPRRKWAFAWNPKKARWVPFIQ